MTYSLKILGIRVWGLNSIKSVYKESMGFRDYGLGIRFLSLNSLKGLYGSTMGVIKGDTRSLDHNAHIPL